MAVNVNVGGNTGPLERDVRAAINRINKSGGLKVRMDDKGVTQPLGNMKRSADEFTKSLEASNARVLAFGASVGIINAVTDAFKGLVNATMQVQKNLTDINVVMGLSNQQLDKFGTGLFKVAAETGAGFQEASKAATEFARQGLTVNETLKRTKDALILTRLTGMDAADSVKSLTAAMNTFGHQVDNSTQLVSKFAAVDVKFAVSAKDFAEAIARAGQSAKSAGVDLDSFVGMVTAVQEKTARGGAVIGNAFKTILTRTQRPQTLKAMENLGIQVRTLNGEVLAADKILLNLSKRWDTLTTSQKANIGQTTAGMFQINLLKAILEDMGEANSRWSEAMGISNRATDESNKKNEQLRATMSALATETGVAVQQLAQTIGDLALAPGINKVLESLKGITEWLNNTLGGGEEEGNKFAMGLVAGMGNYLSGPGLVMFAAVLGKLFVNAVKYGAQSLSSLLNINKAASQRKSIEQAVLAVLTQNSKIQKEMLSTKLTQEKKEAIILGLIKQQTVEAAKLQSISRTMVGPLVRAGVGPNLKMKARGHVPNFANPEKDAAREAGYAPGGVREKNIPGAGRVIYNSAETVRSFAGLSQPAIMPPEGSRAGASYRQAFSGAHGFDPYAAGGYVPNFNRAAIWTTGRTNKWHDKGTSEADWRKQNPYKSQYAGGQSTNYLDLNQLLGEPFMQTMGVMTGQGSQQSHKVNYTQSLASVPELRDRLVQGLSSRNPKQKAAANTLAKNTKVRAGLFTRGVYPTDDGDVQQLATGSRTSWPSTIKSVGGLKGATDDLARKVRDKIFGVGKGEVKVKNGDALNHLLSEKAWQGYMLESAVKAGMGRQLDVGKESQRAFDIDGAAGNSNISPGLRSFMGLPNLRGLELKNSEGAGKGAGGGLANKVMNRIFQDYAKSGRLKAHFEQKVAMAASSGAPKGIIAGPKGAKHAAFGLVPNFAQDGLTESISREEAAMRGRGLPVSAVRIGRSGKLQTKGNPAGLGVTNTFDEPNGLRDVLSAAGLVPNYSVLGVGGSFKNASMTGQHYSKVHKDLERKLKAYAQKVASGTYTQANLTAYMKRVEKDYKIQSSTMVKLNAAMNKEVATRRASGGGGGLRGKIGSFGGFMAGSRTGAQGGGAMGALGRFQGGHGKAGKFGAGLVGMPGMMGGMALSMGAGVVSEYFDPEGTSETAQGASGLMSGAATGAMMGSMLGPLGALAGGVLGAGLGWISGSKKATEAIEKLSTAAKESAVAMHKTALASALSDEKLGEVFNAYSDEGKQALKSSGLEGASNEKVMDHIINKGSGSKKLMAEFFDNNQTKMFKRTVFDKDTKKSKEVEISGGDIAADLRSGKIKGEEYKGLVTQMREYRDNLKEQQKNSIKAMQQRINIQRVIIKSETRFLRSKHLADVKHQRTQQILTSSMQLYAKTFNKAQLHELSYNKKLNTSRKKLNDGLEAASQGYKKGVLQFIQNDGGSGLSQKFRDAINSSGPAKADISKILGADSSRFFKDIKAGNADDAIAGLDPEKLRKVIELLNQKDLLDETIREKLDIEGEKRDQNILKIKQANSLAENQIKFEASVNRELAIRETIMKNIELSNKRSLNLQSQALQITKYVSNVAGLREDISLASVGGGTAAENFQVDQRKRKRDLADSLLENSNSRTETLLSKLMGNENLTDLGPAKMSVLRDEMSGMSASEGAEHLKNTVWKIIDNKRKGGDSKGYNRAEFIDHDAITAGAGGPTPKQIADIKNRTGMHPKDIVRLWDRSEKERVAAIESNLAAKVAVSKQGLAGEGTTRLGKDTGTDTEHARRALWRIRERVTTGVKEWETVKNDLHLPIRSKDDRDKWGGSTTEGKIWDEGGELNVGGIIKSGDKVWKDKYQEKYFKILGLDEEGHVQIEQIVEKTAAITEKTNEVLKKNMIFKWEIAKKEKAHNDLIYRQTQESFLEGKGLSAHTSIESAVKALKVQTAADDRISKYFQRLQAGLEDDDFLEEYGPKSLFESTGGLEAMMNDNQRRDFNDWTRSDRGRDDSLALHGLTRTLSVRGGSDPRQTLAGLGHFQTGLFDSSNDKINKINAAAVPKELVEARSKMLKKMREHGVHSAKPGRWEKLDDNQRKEILDLGEAYEKQLSAFAKTNENIVRYAKVGKVHDGFNHQSRKEIVSHSLSEKGMAKDLRDTYFANKTSSSADRATQLSRGEGNIEDRKTQVNKDTANVEKATEALEKHGSAIARATNQSTVRFAAERRMYDLEAKSIDEITGKHEIKNDTLREEYLLKEKLEQIKYDFVYGADAFSNGMNVAFRDSFEKSARFKHELGKAIPEAFSRSMSDAMMKLIREGGDFGDAMMDVGINFLNTINQKFMENWMDKFMGSFYKGADIPDETLKAADAN
jgi:TP901 family phage tail tape measure protein